MHSPNDAACLGSIDSYVKISEQHAKRIWALNSRKESPSFFDTPTNGDDQFKVFQAQENNDNEVMHIIFSALIFRKDSCSYSCVCVCIALLMSFFAMLVSRFPTCRTRCMYVACLRSWLLAGKIANFRKCLLASATILTCHLWHCTLSASHASPSSLPLPSYLRTWFRWAYPCNPCRSVWMHGK